jgi:hypothetical protein
MSSAAQRHMLPESASGRIQIMRAFRERFSDKPAKPFAPG